MFNKIAVFGVGLVGGSVGLAAKKNNLAGEVIGVGRRLESLRRAKERGAIDSYTLKVDDFSGADLIILAAPISAILNLLQTGLPFLKTPHLLTDVGSTKALLVDCAQRCLPSHLTFVGGHPIAGSEQHGPGSANANLFLNRTTILTPQPDTPAKALKTVRSFWEGLGSRVILLSPEEHDRILALTSHLPHLLAATACLILHTAPFAHKEDCVGTGFQDFTRIAQGEPTIWLDVFLTNRSSLLEGLKLLEGLINRWKEALEKKDAGEVLQLLKTAANFRAQLLSSLPFCATDKKGAEENTGS